MLPNKSFSDVDRLWALWILNTYNWYWSQNIVPSTYQFKVDFSEKIVTKVQIYRDLLIFYSYLDGKTLRITEKGHRLLAASDKITNGIFDIPVC